jgi:ABC-2 type transport system ATP-binding protein
MNIEIKNLSKSFYGVQALKDINLTIEKGMFGLLGRNGAGKTTLMKILATIINKSAGEVTVCGIDISKDKEIRKIIGYLPQDFSVYHTLSVYEGMDYLGVLSGISSVDRKKLIPKLLEQVNLLEYKKVKIKALSGGMKRRLGIAQAIMNDPKVLIVDEPTAGLDPEERIRFRNLLSELAKERIVILSTHIVGDIESTCESIAILEKGSILYKGTVNELTERAKGKVFSMKINNEELPKIKEKYTVTGMLTSGNSVTVRLISENHPCDQAESCEPNVEDAYMYVVGGKVNV